jgi:hypothetical protein
VLARAAVAAIVVVVVGWLAVMERDVRLQARASAESHHGATAAELDAAAADLRSATFLNPDATPDIARAVVENARGQRARAIALIERVVDREPENLLAWQVLALYARCSDPAALRRALDARRRLDPLRARGG